MKKILLRLGFVLGGVLILSLVWLFWYATQKSTINEDYLRQINDLILPEDADPAQNAWVDYDKAFFGYIDPNSNIKQIVENTHGEEAKFILFTDLPPEKQAQIRGWIAQHIDEKPFSEDITAQILRALRNRQFPSNLLEDIFEVDDQFLSESGVPLRLNSTSVVWGSFDQVWAKINSHINNDSFASSSDLRLVAEILVKWAETSEIQDRQLDLWLLKNESVWQSFMEGSKKTQLYFDYTSNRKDELLFNHIRPGFLIWGPLRQLGCWKMRRAVKNGHFEEAWQNGMAMIRTGRLMQQGDYLNSDLRRGSQLIQWACFEMLNILDTQTINAALLVSMQHELEALLPQGPTGRKFNGERLLFHDLVQHVFTQGGSGGGHILYEKYNIWAGWDTSDVDLWESLERWFEGTVRPDWAMTIPGSMRHAKRGAILELGDQFYDRLNELGQRSPWERYSEGITIADNFASLDKTKYGLILTMEPQFVLYEKSIGKAFQNQALTEATVTILTLERYRRESGHYPENLSELLDSEFLHELPDDPYGPGSLTYQRRGDDFVLYSWGMDFADNSGQENSIYPWGEQGGDRVFWPITKQ